MKKKLMYLILSVSFAIVLTMGVCFAIFLPKNTKADTDQNNSQSIETGLDNEYGSESGSVTESEKGGTVYVQSGSTYIMKNGRISNSKNTYGGAIYVASGGCFIMYGGTISNCRATYGGAIFIESGGSFIMHGGTIECNIAD